MTLILSIANSGYIVQASDRLVTFRSTGAVHNSIANKSVVVRARDGLASISYSGIAYMGGLQTDEWIARTISQFSDETGFVTFRGGRRDWRTLNQVVRTLEIVIGGRSERLEGLRIQVAGWRLTGARQFPFIRELAWDRFRPTPPSATPKPWRWPPNKMVIGAIGAEAEGLSLLDARLKEHRNTSNKLYLEDAERILVETIRQVASSNRSVGPNVLTVCVPNPNLRTLPKIEFFATTEHNAVIRNVNGRIPGIQIPVAHTPWLVSASVLAAPTSISGSATINLDGVDVLVVGPQPPPGILFAAGSIGPKSPPKR